MANEHKNQLEELKREIRRSVITLCDHEDEIDKLINLKYTPQSIILLNRMKHDIGEIKKRIDRKIKTFNH